MAGTSQSVDVTWDVVRTAVLDAAGSPDRQGDVAELIATLLGTYVQSPDFATYFRLWQSRGVHVTPVHFYSPIPDTSRFAEEFWTRLTTLPGVDLAEAKQLALLRTFARRFWCEQDFLQVFLAFNRDFEVLLANSYLGLRHEAALRQVFPRSPWWDRGGSFWLRRVAKDGQS